MPLTLTIVENRRLDRATRYTMYLNDSQGGCVELACGPTPDAIYSDAQVALTDVLAALRDRTVVTEVISTDIAEPMRAYDGDRALSVQEYSARYGNK